MQTFNAEAVLFDLDDTLIDHQGSVTRAVGEIYRKFPELESSYKSESIFQLAWSNAHKTFYPRYVRGELTHDEQRILRIKMIWGEIGKELEDQECIDLSDLFLKLYEDHWTTFPDVHPCLEKLNGLKLGIITNGWGEQQRAKLRNCEIFDFFPCVIISGEVSCAKPDSKIFTMACERMGVALKKAAFVGDLFDLDVMGSLSVGMKPFWLQRNSDIAEAKKASNFQQIRSLSELPDLLTR